MGKRIVVVLAHPLKNSLCAHLASLTASLITDAGHDLRIVDLYERNFDPRLTSSERRSYYAEHDARAVAEDAEALRTADVLVLIFPTWWFGLPAILKGWIDRVFVPGVAYDHAPDFGRMIPKLTQLQSCFAITTLGSPWWIDWFIIARHHWDMCPERRLFDGVTLQRGEDCRRHIGCLREAVDAETAKTDLIKNERPAKSGGPLANSNDLLPSDQAP
jgi:NAD(P)H dehydrogenase (quinone)